MMQYMQEQILRKQISQPILGVNQQGRRRHQCVLLQHEQLCRAGWACGTSKMDDAMTMLVWCRPQRQLDSRQMRRLLLNGFLVLGALLGIWLTILLPRRRFLLASFAIISLALLCLSLLPVSAKLPIILSFAMFTLTMSACSNLVDVYPPECFPTELRASGVGLAIATSRIGAAIGTFLLPQGIAWLGFQSRMLLLTATLLLGLLVTFWLAPETRNLSLSQASLH